MNNLNRNVEYDILKGVAAYLVVLGHLLSQVANVTTVWFSFFHMPLFFYVSGFFFVTSLKRHSISDILLSKGRKLLVPYIFWSFLSLIANITVKYMQHALSWETFKAEIIDIFLYARSMWFLVEMMIVFVFFLGCKWIADKVRGNLIAISIVGYIILCICMPNEYFSFYKFKWLFPFFLIGYIVAQKGLTLRYNILTGILLCLSLSVGILSYNSKQFNQYIYFRYSDIKSIVWGNWYYVLSVLCILLANLCIRMVILKITPLSKVLAIIGRYTLDIYVMHMFLVKFIFWKPSFINVNSELYVYIYIPIYAIIVVGLICVTSKYILHKNEIYRFIMGIETVKK